MMRTPAEHVQRTVRDELSEDMAELVLAADWEGPAFGTIGVDGDGRVVTYSDDGMVYHLPVSDGKLAGSPHPDHASTPLRATPHSGEGAVLALDTDDWEWIHPRYRWVTEDGED